MAEDMEKRAAQYIALRDAIKILKDRQKAELEVLETLQSRVGGIIQNFMETNSLNNISTSAGTCYVSTRYTATVADKEAFIEFVKAGHWDLIERRASSEAVQDYVKDHNILPPGVNLSGIQTLGVRRPSNAKE